MAQISGIISDMNFSILKYEFESLIQGVEQEEKGGTKGAILSEQFFNISETPATISSNISKGHNIMSNRITQPAGSMSIRNNEAKQKDKSNRQDIIIGLLKKGGELGIKDFTSAIKGCSEKTIQRELMSLIFKGQIKKAGEKRWSRYSLK